MYHFVKKFKCEEYLQIQKYSTKNFSEFINNERHILRQNS
jgi:hypothetical protein